MTTTFAISIVCEQSIIVQKADLHNYSIQKSDKANL